MAALVIDETFAPAAHSFKRNSTGLAPNRRVRGRQERVAGNNLAESRFIPYAAVGEYDWRRRSASRAQSIQNLLRSVVPRWPCRGMGFDL